MADSHWINTAENIDRDVKANGTTMKALFKINWLEIAQLVWILENSD